MADKIITRNKVCRGCGSANLDLILSLKPSPIGDAYISIDNSEKNQPCYPIDLFMCSSCGLAQLIDVIDPQILYGDYIYVTASSLGLNEHFTEYANQLIQRVCPESLSLVVDIGSNDGTLLKRFSERGLQILGVEPAAHIAELANASGVTTEPVFFNKDEAKRLKLKYGSAKIITANNVFANIDDITSWLEAIKILLDDDGVYVFESFYLLDLVRNMVFDFIYHEHLTAFSVRPVEALAKKSGMELVAVDPVHTKGGSLRYFLQKPNGPLKIDGSVAKYLAKEKEFGLYNNDNYLKFTDDIDSLRKLTKSFLESLKTEGVKIVGFGASITCTTLIYHFEVGEYLDYLVDDNPAKQGLYSPGLHLPVYPSSRLYEDRPDYVLILAWRFSGAILDRNNELLKHGSKFILPVPQFEVVGN